VPVQRFSILFSLCFQLFTRTPPELLALAQAILAAGMTLMLRNDLNPPAAGSAGVRLPVPKPGFLEWRVEPDVQWGLEPARAEAR
jgi:hypothetical protein